MRIKFKFLLVTFLFLLLPSLVVGATAYTSSKNQLDAAGQKELKNNVRLVLSMINLLDQQVQAGKVTLADAQEQVKQQMLGPKSADGKRPTNKKIDLGEHGYFLAYDTQGVEVAHPTLEGKNMYDTTSPDGKKIVQLSIQAAQNGGGFVSYEWALPDDKDKTAPKIVYAELDPHWNWVVVAGSYESDYNAGANGVLDTLLVTLLASLVIGGVLAYLFATRTTRPISQLAEQVRRVSNGDLEIQDIPVTSRDDLGQLAADFNTMTGKLKTLINSVKHSSDSLFASANHLARSADQTSQASHEITSNMMEVAAGTEQQIQSVSSSSGIVHLLADGAEQIAAHARHVSDSTQAALQKADAGNFTVGVAKQQMESIHESVDRLADLVHSLESRSQEIGDLTQAITTIANQTNLLALNAAIEAARAGEHGRGFAVVADEVRKLAEQSSASAEHIGQVIARIQAETAQAGTTMEKATDEVARGLHTVSEAGQSFEEIQAAIQQVQEKIDQVAANSQRMVEGTHKVVDSIDGIMSVAASSSNAAQNVSAAAEEQLASMEEIANSSDALSRMSEELREIVRQFETASSGSWSVKVLHREQHILELVWSGVITKALVEEVNHGMLQAIHALNSTSFDVLVDTRTLQVVLPEAQQPFADHQKLMLDKGMRRAAVVLDSRLAKSQLDQVKQNSGNTVETQWATYEEALAFLQK